MINPCQKDAKLETSTLEKEQSNDSALQAEDRRLRRLRKRKNTVPSPSTLSQTPTSSPVPLEVSLGAAATAVTTKRFDRIIIIVHENTSYDKAMKNQYFGTNLTSRGALFTAYNALMYGNSYPEYMAMTGGNTYTASVVDATCIADLLEAKGLTWRNYLESYPGNCFLGDSDPYVERHSPFVSYKSIQNNKTRCNNGVVNLNQFNSDWKSGKLPTYSLVSPNQNHNGHAGDISKSVAWTKSFLEPLLADKALMNRTLIVLPFDEVTTGETGYHICPFYWIYGQTKANHQHNLHAL